MSNLDSFLKLKIFLIFRKNCKLKLASNSICLICRILSYLSYLSSVYTTTFLARYPFKFGPGAYNLRPGTLHFCRVNGKIRGTSTPKQTSAETMWIGSLGPRMFWGTRATIFSIYTTKMEGAGPKILGTGAKFKQVPCQKNCRVNWALKYPEPQNTFFAKMNLCTCWKRIATIFSFFQQILPFHRLQNLRKTKHLLFTT